MRHCLPTATHVSSPLPSGLSVTQSGTPPERPHAGGPSGRSRLLGQLVTICDTDRVARLEVLRGIRMRSLLTALDLDSPC
jgi:hypothetical protein